ARADISINNAAKVDVRAGGGGSITVNAQNFEVTQGSQLLTGIPEGSGTPEFQAGDITVNATDAIKFDGESKDGEPSGAFNQVGKSGAGKAGAILITTGSLAVTNGARLDTSTFGKGDAGSVTIIAKDAIKFDGESKSGEPGGAFSQVNPDGTGKGGGVSITTGLLEVLNGARLDASTYGKGDAGSVTITAKDAIKFDGEGTFSSGAFSRVTGKGEGKGGGISITTGSLAVTSGANFDVSTYGKGDAGSVTITATDTTKFDGEGKKTDPYRVFTSGVFSGVGSVRVSPSDASRGAGKGGNVSITTGSLEVLNGARFEASTYGEGDAGNITITAKDAIKFDGESNKRESSGAFSQVNSRKGGNAGSVSITTGSLEVLNGSRLDVSTYGKGDAGSVTITATDTTKFDGEGKFPSGAFSRVTSKGGGNAGSVAITTGSLAVTNGAYFDVGTYANGNAGSVTITATDTTKFDGESKKGDPSGALSSTREFSKVGSIEAGKAGSISIATGLLEVLNGALLDVSTIGNANAGIIDIIANTFNSSNGGRLVSSTSNEFPAGNIILKVKDNITLSGSNTGIFASTTENSTGKGGSIIIDPKTLILRDGASIFANSQGKGVGGNIELSAGFLTLDNGKISTDTQSNTGGNITLNVQDLLLLRNGSKISTNAGTLGQDGNGGNITINSKFIVAFPSEDSDISANASRGNGGNIEINSQGIFGIEPYPKETHKSGITANSVSGVTGVINLNTPENSSIQNSFTQISPNLIDTNALIANSCISRGNQRQENSFTITGSGGLRNSPGDALMSDYSTGEVRNIEPTSRPWKKGDPIIEAQGLYRLPDGQLILSRTCD
nr:S-layer family protein [Nostoc sp. DedSLP05]MDZ8101931.1 S-layer family protein [Nostoc sp. DedSLP01]